VLWFEDVTLRVRGRVIAHLDSLIEPLTLPDLPMVVWFVDGLPRPGDSLLSASDVLLVDARDFGDVDCFAQLLELVPHVPIVDLSWVRLRPWREMLTGLFDGPAFKPFAQLVRHAEVAGKTGPRHLLGGWLLDRLALAPGELHLEADDHVLMRLRAVGPDGRAATFEVGRTGDERVVRAHAEVEGGPSSTAIVRLPEATPAWGLAAALSALHADPIYERALGRALS
jgi:glucose-6-phosphate dehydrogenase assembly protein OpcA